MDTYHITPKNENFRGEALVAAETSDEALETFRLSDEFNNIYFDDMNLNCAFIPNLLYTTDVSRIITDCIY